MSLKFIYLVFVCVHACMGMCTYVCALTCACGTQGFWKGVFLWCSLPYIWNRISLNLDPTYCASLAAHWAACIYLCPLPQQRSNRPSEVPIPELLYGVLWDGSARKSICRTSLSTWIEFADLKWRWIKRIDFTTCSLDLQTVLGRHVFLHHVYALPQT